MNRFAHAASALSVVPAFVVSLAVSALAVPAVTASLATATLLAAAAPVSAQQRPTGVVGQYVPPRVWPQGQHDYDLVHQKIAVQFDEAKRLVTGRVTTTVVPSERTDTIRLNAQYITIDGATDARGRRLRFMSDSDHVTVRLRRRVPAG
ncbi:MAG TPA: hypothetical protein VJ957_06880, partial [Longimicrobiales bacterium]|nr:hypothetical protein [Longimicrobiales bacterium]